LRQASAYNLSDPSGDQSPEEKFFKKIKYSLRNIVKSPKIQEI
jgi:hypothetical protein